MNFFTEEHEVFRASFRSFLEREVVPHVDQWEKEGKIERLIWKKFGDQGYFGLRTREEFTGLDLDLFYTVIFLEELQRINSGGFAAAMWAHQYLAMTHLQSEGNDWVKENYLVPSVAGEKIGALCISEPFGGSDVAGMRTTAKKHGDKYLINGSKTFITNGVYADYYVVSAKTQPELGSKGISLFLVDTKSKGIHASKLDKLGWRASDTAEISFDNVEVDAHCLLGEEDKGFGYIMQHFALERLIMGVNAHARAEYALEYAIQYMSEREAFGKTIDQFQALRHKVAELSARVEMVKSFNYVITSRLENGDYVVKEASMSKLESTRIADEVIYDCLQLLGGYGYMEDYPLARMFRDSRLGPIGGGTSEILKEIIAKMVIDKKSYKKTTK